MAPSIRLLLLVSLLAVPAVLLADDPPIDNPAQTRVQVLKLRGLYAEHPAAGGGLDPMTLLTGGGEKEKAFYKLLERLDEVAADPNVDAVFMDFSAPIGLNQAQVAEILRHLARLREAKPTVAWLDNAGNLQYMLASACDQVVMTDFASLDLSSLAMSSMHFKDAMDLLGVHASVARAGNYKGAVEPFMLSRMSEHLRAHYLRMLGTMNDYWVEQIADHRKLAVGHVRGLQSQRLFTATTAREAGLVDALAPHGEERKMAECLLERKDVTWLEKRKKKAQPFNFFQVFSELMGAGVMEKKISKPTIAVLHLQGAIVDGKKASPGSMVSGPTVEAIQKLIDHEQVKGVVVRVDSPGGSATASEAIRRALQELADKKPVVVAMGRVAASGGYWISCLGRPIYAEPGTITGSIGVLALKLDFGPVMRRVGVHIENITLDDSASMMAMNRGWSPQEIDKIETFIADTYTRFLTLVAGSRDMDVEAVKPIAGGRVWSGTQAKSLGLVDHIGGVPAALAAVAREAGLEPGYDVLHRPRQKQLFELLQLGNQGDDLTSLLSPVAVGLLEKSGFDLRPLLHLAWTSAGDSTPMIWALAPVEFTIR